MWDHCHWMNMIKNVRVNVRVKAYGTGGWGSCPPIRAVCWHEFGQRVDITRAKHNTCLNNTNLWSVTAVNGTKNTNLEYVTAVNGKILPPHRIGIPENFCYYPPHRIWIPEKFWYYPPPPRIHSGKTRSAPSRWMLARTPMKATHYK